MSEPAPAATVRALDAAAAASSSRGRPAHSSWCWPPSPRPWPRRRRSGPTPPHRHPRRPRVPPPRRYPPPRPPQRPLSRRCRLPLPATRAAAGSSPASSSARRSTRWPSWITGSAASAADDVIGLFVVDPANPDLTAPWFLAAYYGTGSAGGRTGPPGSVVIAAWLMLLVVLASVMSGVIRGDIAGMVRLVCVRLPVAIFVTFIAIWLVSQLLASPTWPPAGRSSAARSGSLAAWSLTSSSVEPRHRLPDRAGLPGPDRRHAWSATSSCWPATPPSTSSPPSSP